MSQKRDTRKNNEKTKLRDELRRGRGEQHQESRDVKGKRFQKKDMSRVCLESGVKKQEMSREREVKSRQEKHVSEERNVKSQEKALT